MFPYCIWMLEVRNDGCLSGLDTFASFLIIVKEENYVWDFLLTSLKDEYLPIVLWSVGGLKLNRGVLLIRIIVGQGPTVLAIDEVDIFYDRPFTFSCFLEEGSK